MRRSTVIFLLGLSISIFLTACGTSRMVCNSTCGCGLPSSSACPADVIPLLYATMTSNQILGFSISNTGSLTALPSTAGPAGSESVALNFNAVMFADTSNNTVDSFTANQVTGALTSVAGSPFSLGSPDGGPTSIALGPSGLYATEPNGTIVGFGTTSLFGALGSPLPNSPYPAGVAPSQMAFCVALCQEKSGTFGFLYVSDPGDSSGGILAYSLDSSGSLTPIQGSPFPTLPNANPSFVLFAQGVQGGGFLLVSLTNAAQVAVFGVDETTGALTPVPGSPFSVGNGPGTLVEDESNHVFVMNGADHTVAAFNLGSNGMLTAIGTPVAVGTANGGMAYYLGPNPFNYLYVADTTSSAIWTLNLDGTTGQLTAAGAPLTVASPPLQLVLVSP
jgi:hypothetical protein